MEGVGVETGEASMAGARVWPVGVEGAAEGSYGSGSSRGPDSPAAASFME